MNPAQLLQHFDTLAATPEAVAKLRALVLQLAVQGGLAPHSEAEPAVPYASAEGATPINVTRVPANWRVHTEPLTVQLSNAWCRSAAYRDGT